MAMRLHVALVCALCLLAFTPIARAGDDLDLSAGDFKISVGADDDHEGSSEQDKEPGELVIKLPPEPKAARAYVPIHATIEDQNGDPVPGGQLTAVAVQQPIVVAPVIGAQGAPYGACTDNCDAEMAPPPVQIAGPTVASQILNKEIFEDESYIPVPETQVEAKPAMVSVPMHLRDGGGAANDQTVAPDGGPTKRGLNVQDPESTPPYLNSGGDPTNRGGCPGPACSSTVDEGAHQAREEKYKKLLSMDKKKRKKMSEETKKQHEDELDELKKQVDKDRETLAKEKEKARASRQDEEDRKEEQFQEERSKWKKKERAEEETQKDEERKRAELKLKLMKAKVKAQQVDDASDDIEDITAEIAALKKKLKAKQAGTRA